MSTLLALVVQNPVPGKVFADLVGDLTADQASKVYRAAVMDMCQRYANLNVRSRVLLYGPKGSRKAVGLLSSNQWRLVARKGLDRGQTLIDLAERAFRGGHRRVLALWPKAATLPASFVVDAFDQLLVDDIVIGPTVDGDIYGVGFSVEAPHVFMGFDWSDGDSVFDRLVDRVERLALVFGVLPHWYGIDRSQSLPTLASHLRAQVVADGHPDQPRLAEVMSSIRAAKESGTIGL
jgi:uncharacterized protein